MASVTMVSLLLEAADKLIEERPRSSAFRRRAVSTAYYAVFHALAKLCADSLLATRDRGTDDYERVYRALDHGPLKNAFKGPLKDQEPFRKIGELVVSLQSERHRADYLPPTKSVFSRREAKELAAQARSAVGLIEALDGQNGRTLATFLLFRAQRQ